MKNVTLRIKKRYLDAIAAGEKTTEYRNCIPYYADLFSKGVGTVTLHYQTSRRLVIEVERVERIPKPPELAASKFVTTDEVFAIRLGRIIDNIPERQLFSEVRDAETY